MYLYMCERVAFHDFLMVVVSLQYQYQYQCTFDVAKFPDKRKFKPNNETGIIVCKICPLFHSTPSDLRFVTSVFRIIYEANSTSFNLPSYIRTILYRELTQMKSLRQFSGQFPFVTSYEKIFNLTLNFLKNWQFFIIHNTYILTIDVNKSSGKRKMSNSSS